MKTIFNRPLLLLALSASLAFVGCESDNAPLGSSDDDISGTQTLETLDLDATYGDLSYTDEAEAFGDATLLAAAMIDEAELATDDEDSLTGEDPTLNNPQWKRTYVRILWGQLDGDFDRENFDPAALELLDWSGTVSVDTGVVFLKRTILFERPRDHRLPRDDRRSLGWVSHTGPHYDGILICVASPLDEGAPIGELTLETGPYTMTWSLSELDGMDMTTEVDLEGNAVSVVGKVFDPQFCGNGFLGGFWRSGEDRPETEAIEMGGFRGRYVGQNGGVGGFLKGIYGLNSSGERVMIGKYIDRNGRVRGLIRGTWEPAADAEGVGSFQARWVNRNGQHAGTLEGRYMHHEEEARGDGFFQGRWQENCGAVDTAE